MRHHLRRCEGEKRVKRSYFSNNCGPSYFTLRVFIVSFKITKRKSLICRCQSARITAIFLILVKIDMDRSRAWLNSTACVTSTVGHYPFVRGTGLPAQFVPQVRIWTQLITTNDLLSSYAIFLIVSSIIFFFLTTDNWRVIFLALHLQIPDPGMFPEPTEHA